MRRATQEGRGLPYFTRAMESTDPLQNHWTTEDAELRHVIAMYIHNLIRHA